jgi:hypothetical protein
MVIATKKRRAVSKDGPQHFYSTISTMRRVRGSTKTVRPFTTV